MHFIFLGLKGTNIYQQGSFIIPQFWSLLNIRRLCFRASAVKGRLVLFLPDGYAILMRSNKAETAVHGCQCPGDRLYACVRYWPYSGVGVRACHLLSDCLFFFRTQPGTLWRIGLTRSIGQLDLPDLIFFRVHDFLRHCQAIISAVAINHGNTLARMLLGWSDREASKWTWWLTVGTLWWLHPLWKTEGGKTPWQPGTWRRVSAKQHPACDPGGSCEDRTGLKLSEMPQETMNAMIFFWSESNSTWGWDTSLFISFIVQFSMSVIII